jgi:hypothetical protein
MFRANNDRLRHKILKIWEERVITDLSPYTNLSNYWETPNSICQKAKITANQYHRVKDILVQNSEMAVSFDQGKERAIIIENGVIALKENKYPNMIWEKRVAKIKNFLSIAVWIITIATALGSLIFAFHSMNSDQKRIRELEKEVQQLKAQSINKP